MRPSRVLLVFACTALLAISGVYALQGCGGGTKNDDSNGGGGEDAGTCEADCANKDCGDDGCGGSCGDCGSGSSCQSDGTCKSTDNDTCTQIGSSCGGGKGCYWDYDPVCLSTGTRDIGETCSDPNDCKLGSTCLSTDDGITAFCFGVCPSPTTCDGDSACEDIGIGFKVCVCSCDPGFMCDSDSQCVVDPNAMWTVKLISGTVTETDPSGEAWDVPGGMPDTFVCLTVDADEICSGTADDTLSPSWNDNFGTFTAADLMAGVDVAIWDEDVSDDDAICGKGTITITEQDWSNGLFDAECEYAKVDFVLTPSTTSCTVGKTCGSGKACYYYDEGSTCKSAGSKDVGEPCTQANDCRSGQTCLAVSGSDAVCWAVCWSAGNCEASTCTDTELGFSVCVAD